MKTRLGGERSFRRFALITLGIMTILSLLPVILIVIASFTDENSLIANGYSYFPAKWSLDAYFYMIKQAKLITRAYGISFFVTITGTLLSVLFTTTLAYPMSRKDFKFSKILTFLVFFTMLFNGGLVPTYINYTTVFHVKDTFFGLLVPSLMMSAFNVLLMKSYFVTGVPDEILEAAYIDGANEFQTMWKIAIPLSKPIITTVAMFSGIAYWNDWNNGYIYLTKRTDLYSIQNLLNRLMQNIQALTQNANNMAQAGEGLSQIPSGTVRMAMAALGILPIMIIYPFIQKNFVKGITLGGVKG